VYDLNFIETKLKDFMNLPEEIQKKSLRTILFPMIKNNIQRYDPKNVDIMTPKVTGMLIDFEVL